MEVFCNNCQKQIKYKEKAGFDEKLIRGHSFKYPTKTAYCSECNSRLYVKEIEGYNAKSLDTSYRKYEGLISVKDIQKILDKYKIGKRPLSLLLGWGEGTLTRYLDGDIPTKPYSDMLIDILEDEEYFREILEENKGNITDIAYKRSSQALKETSNNGKLELATSSKIESAARYLLVEGGEITPLALQKLLYFTQGFHKTFTGVFLFKEDCQAWIYGPVFPKIYRKFKDIGWHPADISKVKTDNINLTESEKNLLNHIVLYFGCYSGKVLEFMTHIEEPWRNNRMGLEADEESSNVISKKEIALYFDNVKEKYKMLNFTDIKDYSLDLFNKINI